MNAVSMYIMANQEYSKNLRYYVHQNMSNYPSAIDIRLRWQRERDWQNSKIPDAGLIQFTNEVWIEQIFIPERSYRVQQPLIKSKALAVTAHDEVVCMSVCLINKPIVSMGDYYETN